MNTVNACDALLCAHSIFVPLLSGNSKQIQITSTKCITLNFSPATSNACFVPVTKCTVTVAQSSELPSCDVCLATEKCKGILRGTIHSSATHRHS